MIKNYWLDRAEEEDVTYFRNKLFTPLNMKLLDDPQTLAAIWKKIGILEGLDKKWDRATTAVLLEGQRLCNEK